MDYSIALYQNILYFMPLRKVHNQRIVGMRKKMVTCFLPPPPLQGERLYLSKSGGKKKNEIIIILRFNF